MAQIPLPGSAIPQFRQALPRLSAAGGTIDTILAGTEEIVVHMREFQANILPPGTAPGPTWVYGYLAGDDPVTGPRDTFTGPVIVATRGVPTSIRWVNDLGRVDASQVPVWAHGSDQTLHWADPLGDGHSMANYAGPVPAVPHLHGGEVPPVLDGGPDSWFTGDGLYYGHAYYAGLGGGGNAAVYRYPNTQEAGPLWFHDHVLGGTRLNVYAGLAGAYPLIDPNLSLPTGLHPVGLQQGAAGPVDHVVPLVIQDRSFDTNGQLLFHSAGINPEHPFWVPEFEGDTITVNGKAWPYLDVEPRRYRFLIINGSNARAYELFLTNPVTKVNGPAVWQLGTDGGYLDTPVRIDPNAPKGQLQRLVILPGERADIVIDFAGYAGQNLVLRNIARHPFPGGLSPAGSTLGRILQFRVAAQAASDASYDPASGIPLRPPMVRLVDPATGMLAAGVVADKTRQLTLNEVIGTGGPLELLVNNTKWSGRSADGSIRPDFTPVTVGGTTEGFSELPAEGDTEVWEIINLTADAHPIHTHLTQVQLLNRQAFNVGQYTAAYDAAFPVPPGSPGGYLPGYGPPLDYHTGNPGALGGNPDVTPFLRSVPKPPDANEAGWKDTVTMYPGQVTRIVVRYAPTDTPAGARAAYPFDPDAGGHGFVWHCHIVDHEDNEMMRPNKVTPDPTASRSYLQGTDY
ncbi:MAG TPA: multicopper oxidase domain-containing protein [Pseudonocardiaceae bacterium]|nr:multicopper oxidase domain-containing protein [Pseudonocardiaceae bacterium]